MDIVKLLNNNIIVHETKDEIVIEFKKTLKIKINENLVIDSKKDCVLLAGNKLFLNPKIKDKNISANDIVSESYDDWINTSKHINEKNDMDILIHKK